MSREQRSNPEVLRGEGERRTEAKLEGSADRREAVSGEGKMKKEGNSRERG